MNWKVGDRITNQGRVARRDVTRFGLHRMRVELVDCYPDLSIWVQALGPRAKPILHDYRERKGAGRVMICALLLYWKEEDSVGG